MIKNGGYDLKLNKWRASQPIDFFHRAPNKSQGSHLGDQLPGGPRILLDKVYCQSILYQKFKLIRYQIKLDKQMIEKENFKHEQDHKSYDDDILEMINLCLNNDKVYC